MTTHLKSNSREYKAWRRMKSCCYNSNFPYYSRYGGRGVTVCKEWLNDFARFIEDMGEMPTHCNGIQLIDENLHFCKLNCKWTKRSAGRIADPKIPGKKKKLRNKLQNPKSICLVLEKDHLDFIRSQALQKSIQEGRVIEANEMIREALARAFPAPKQFDMFGNKNRA